MGDTVDSLEGLAAQYGASAVGVLVIHEEELVHLGWRLLLSRHPWVARCLGAGDIAKAVALVEQYGPSVAILDLDAGHEYVSSVAMALRSASPTLSILLLSGSTTISAKAANAMGATGVVRKSLPAVDLANAVRAVSSGKRLFAIATPFGAARLSDREKEVLGLMSAGATNREIAARLQVSAETVKRHAATIFRKLEVRNRTEAAQRGREFGLDVPRPQVLPGRLVGGLR